MTILWTAGGIAVNLIGIVLIPLVALAFAACTIVLATALRPTIHRAEQTT